MLKKRSQLFEFLSLGYDLVVVALAWCLAYWLRFKSGFFDVPLGIPAFEQYLSMLLFIGLIWAFVFRRVGLYRPMRGVSRFSELWLILNANSLAVLLLIALTFLFREKTVPFSRLVFLQFWLISTVLLAASRLTLRVMLRELRRRGYNLRYMLVVGSGRVAADIIARIRLHRELGMQIVGCLSNIAEKGQSVGGVQIVGTYSDLANILDKSEIDKVMIALPLQDNHLLPGIISALRDRLVDVKVVPDLYQFVSLGGFIEEFDGLPVISIQSSPLDGLNLYAKRGFDLVVGSTLFVLSLPLMTLIAAGIKATSRGPLLYRQQRASMDGSRFYLYKFRTMHVDAEKNGPGWTVPNDQRVTALGKILRSLSLDELPQLYNVIRGDMSLVGPRPERPVYIEEFRQKIPRYMLRHKVPAGLTGWAQVNGWRGDSSVDKRIEYDLYYIENWSLLLDIKIVLLTLIRGFKNKNAY